MPRSRTVARMRYLKSIDEIPRFKDEAEEADFWSTHSLAEIWDRLEPVEVEVGKDLRRLSVRQTRKKPVTLRLEEQQINRAKRLARAKSLSYQALMRSWISEGIARAEHSRKRA